MFPWLGMSYSQVTRIELDAVVHSLEQTPMQPKKHIGIDATSFQRRHKYVDLVKDLHGWMLHVVFGSTVKALASFFQVLSEPVKSVLDHLDM